MNRRIATAAVALLAASPALAACGSSNPSAAVSSALGTNNATAGGYVQPADKPGLPTVKLMVGGWDKQIYLPYVLAQQLGYYQKYGVNVELSTESNGGVGAEDAMASGQVDMAGAWYEHTISFQDKQVAVESIVQLSLAPGERIMCSNKSGVHSAADFKGKKMGVTDLGSGTDVLTQYIAAKAGVKHNQYTTVAAHAGAAALTALQNGQVDCAMTTQPTVQAIESQGVGTSVVDLATSKGATAALGATWPAAGVLAKTSWVNSHQKEAQAVVNALVATLKWMQKNGAAGVANELPQSFVSSGLSSKADYIKALNEDFGQFSATGLMPATGPASVLASLVLTKNATGNENLATTYTNSFVNSALQTVK